MAQASVRTVLLALSSIALAPGCTAILGDFSTGPDAGPETGGGSSGGSSSGGAMEGSVATEDGGDATIPPTEGGPVESGQEGEAAALQILSCTTWEQGSPTLVMKLYPPEGGMGGGGGTPFNNVIVEHVPSLNAARILVSTNGSPSGITIATISESGSGTPSIINLGGMGFQAERKTSADLEFLAQNFMSGQYGYYAIEDADPGTSNSGIVGPAATIGTLPGMSTGAGSNVQMQFLPLSPSGFYTLASYQVSGGYQAAAWLPGATQWNVVIPSSSGSFQINSALLQDGTNVYGFYAPPGSGNNGPSAIDQYTFPTTSMLGPASRSVLGSPSETAVTGAVAAASGSYELAFVELTGAQSAALKLGVVSEANINTFTTDDLATLTFNVQSDGGFFDTTPFGGRSGQVARWLSNGELGVLGTGGTGNSTGYTGLNFYVATSSGQWLVETAGTGQNVLAGQTIIMSAFDLAQAVSDIVLKFDLAWVAEDMDGGYSLYFNVLDCQI